MSGVETSEAALRQLIRDLTGNSEVALARVRENLDAILQFWEAAGKPGSDPLSWADTESKRDPNSSDAEVAALTTLQAAYSRLGDYPARLKSAKVAVETAKGAATAAQLKAQECVQTIAADAGEVMGVLESARAYLHKHPAPTVCPLCESAEKVQGLDQRIIARLASFSSLRTAQAQTRTTGASVQRAEQQLEMLRASAKKHAEDFEKARAGFAWSADITMPAAPAPLDIEALETWLAGAAHLPGQWKKAETVRQDKKQFIGALKRALKTYTENVQAQKELDTLLPKLNRALEIVEEERRLFSDNILGQDRRRGRAHLRARSSRRGVEQNQPRTRPQQTRLTGNRRQLLRRDGRAATGLFQRFASGHSWALRLPRARRDGRSREHDSRPR